LLQFATKELAVENWGQGPWFELERDDPIDDAADVADGATAADVADVAALERPSHDDAVSRSPATPPDAQEARGGDVAAAHGDGDLDAAPANIFDLDAGIVGADIVGADIVGADIGSADVDGEETFSDADTWPPRPAQLARRFYPSTGPSRPFASSSPVTRKPVWTPPPEYSYDDFLRRSSAHGPSVSTRLAPPETTAPRAWRLPRPIFSSRPIFLSRAILPARPILLATSIALVLVLGAGLFAASAALHLLAPFALSGASHAGGGQPTASATSGVPLATTAAVVTLTAATQQLSVAGDLTSCPSGCDLTGQTYSASRAFSKQAPATQIPQTTLSGTIHVINNGSGDWGPISYSFSGGGYTCNPRNVYVPQGTSQDYSCFISASSPSTVLAHTIEGNPAPNVSYTQPAALHGNGSYQVTAGDCQAALDDTKTNQGVAWAVSWQSGQSIPGGWQWAKSAPTTSFSNDSCPIPPPQATPFNFTASSTTTASNNAYNPAAAQSLARARLNGQLPSGYAWKSGDPSACSVAVKSSSGTSVTLACPASGTAVYAWTDALKAELAAKLLGKSKDDAVAACNSAPGVQTSSCAITLRDGASSLPDAATDVTIQVNQP
jgi:hypothetical protein